MKASGSETPRNLKISSNTHSSIVTPLALQDISKT